ncbi:hypothetical protein ACUXV3_18150 [Roseobacteraceae bacterium NS-SX3]
MISAISSTAHARQTAQRFQQAQAGRKAPGEAGGPAVDGAVANGLTQGLARSGRHQESLKAPNPRLHAADYIDPARAAARAAAYGFQRGAGVNLTGSYQELLAGCAMQAPLVNAKSAGTRYRAARAILG